MSGTKTSRQAVWASKRFDEYIQIEGSEDAYLRGLHYFIVSKIDKSDSRRWLYAKKPSAKQRETLMKEGLEFEDYFKEQEDKSWIRLYRNTLNEYKNLSMIVTDARMAGLIGWSILQDHKNDEINRTIGGEYSFNGNGERREAELDYISSDEANTFDVSLDQMDDWETWKNTLDFHVSRPYFFNQTHRLVVIVEKSKARSAIERICKKHGADFIQFGGQASVTRLYQLCKFAKDEDKPMRILYLSDLDVSGWFMPESVEKRVQEIYPNPKNEVIRVGLVRKQAEAWDLVSSFDIKEKKYNQGIIDRFVRETGSIIQIELDAIPKDLLLNLIESELGKYAELEKDDKDYDETNEKYQEAFKELEIEDDDEEDYNEIMEEYNEKIREISRMVEDNEERLNELIERRSDIVSEIEEKIKKQLRKEVTGEEEESEEEE